MAAIQSDAITKQSGDSGKKADQFTLSVLQDAIASGMINLDNVLDEIMSKKREEALKKHPYAITPPTSEGGRWQTCIKDATGKRKNIKASTREALLDKLVEIYFSDSHIDNLTFYGLYEEWLEHKKEITSSSNTIKRHGQHYKKYFEPSVLHDMKLKKIDSLLLEKECNSIVKEFNLSHKEWCNAKTIISGMFEYALRKNYISDNPMLKVRITVKYRQVVKKTGKTETYNTEELKALNDFLEQQYEETQDASFLAVKVNFLLGLRVGELVALKWCDICNGNYLHIVREEIRDQTANRFEVVEHTKTHQDRFIPLMPKVVSELGRIEKQGEFIFMRNGSRITATRIAVILRMFARYEGKPVKSSHKIRKTYASMLNSGGVPLDFIRECLGHTDLKTTLGYIYNPLPESQTFDLLKHALE